MVPMNVSEQTKPQYDMQPHIVTDPRCKTWGVRVTNRGKKFLTSFSVNVNSSEFLRSKGNNGFVAENNFCEVNK